MKKKILFIVSLFIFLIKVNAQINIDVTKPIIRFPKEGEYVLQGFTNIDNRLFTVFIEPSSQKPKVKIFNLNNGKLIKEFIASDLGHANDVTYNKKNNKIYVVHGNGKKIIHVFDGDDYSQSQFNISLPIRSMTYIEDKDIYAVRTVASGFYLNEDFSLKSRIPFIVGMNFSSDVGRQGWTYYDGLLYYTTWSWIRYGGDGTNTIKVYSISGDKLDDIVTDSGIGELEDVSFYNDKMLLGFNTYDDFIEFYLIDNPQINRETFYEKENKEQGEKKKEVNNKKYIYIVIISVIVLAILKIMASKKM